MIAALSLALAMAVAPQPKPAHAGSQAKPPPLDIRADHLTVRTKDNRGLWKGHVHAVRPPTSDQPKLDLTCDELVTDFEGEDKLEKATCTGNVEVVQGDRRGWGEVAVYDSEKGELVVTGNPRGQQGANRWRGDKLTFHVDSDLIDIVNPVVDTPAPAQLGGTPQPKTTTAEAPSKSGGSK